MWRKQILWFSFKKQPLECKLIDRVLEPLDGRNNSINDTNVKNLNLLKMKNILGSVQLIVINKGVDV